MKYWILFILFCKIRIGIYLSPLKFNLTLWLVWWSSVVLRTHGSWVRFRLTLFFPFPGYFPRKVKTPAQIKRLRFHMYTVSFYVVWVKTNLTSLIFISPSLSLWSRLSQLSLASLNALSRLSQSSLSATPSLCKPSLRLSLSLSLYLSLCTILKLGFIIGFIYTLYMC